MKGVSEEGLGGRRGASLEVGSWKGGSDSRPWVGGRSWERYGRSGQQVGVDEDLVAVMAELAQQEACGVGGEGGVEQVEGPVANIGEVVEGGVEPVGAVEGPAGAFAEGADPGR